MFRIFYKLSSLGRFTADVCLAVFLLCLFFPILPGIGIFNPVTNSQSSPNYFIALGKNPILLDIVLAITISFISAFLLMTVGLIFGYLTHSTYTGKFILVSAVSFWLIVPDSISFLVNLPLVSIISTKNLHLITYLSSSIWGFAVALLAAYSFFHGISRVELQTVHMLGGNHFTLITTYLIPKAKKLIINGGIALGCLFSLQGLYTYQQVRGSKSLLLHELIIPLEYYSDPGPGGAIYGLLLLIALFACIFAIRCANLEVKLATVKRYQRKVRRRQPKKRNKPNNKKKNVEPTPILELTEESNAENIESVQPLEDSVTQQSESMK